MSSSSSIHRLPRTISDVDEDPLSAILATNENTALSTRPPLAPIDAPQSPQSRRRRRDMSSVSNNSMTSTSSIGSSSQSNNNNANNASTGLRASLDAGMAALKRWARSHPTDSSNEASTSSNNNAGGATTSRRRKINASTNNTGDDEVVTPRSRSVTWQHESLFQSASDAWNENEEESTGLPPAFGTSSNSSVSTPTPRSRLDRLSRREDVIYNSSDSERTPLREDRPRTFSEPTVTRVRDFFFDRSGERNRQSVVTSSISTTNTARRRRRPRADSSNPALSPLSSSAAAALYTSTSESNIELPRITGGGSTNRNVLGPTNTSIAHANSSHQAGYSMSSVLNTHGDTNAQNNTGTTFAASANTHAAPHQPSEEELERLARMRWMRINRRFQLVITVVALVFSLLLFAILISWVVLTSAYVVSFDKSCDVPLKPYFWLVTWQLVLDVFRSDIMRLVFQWDSNSNQRIPPRVIAYNIAYLLYALMVLRLGLMSVFLQDTTCHKSAPELYNASAAFVSLSVAAWATIICGYLLPFCVVAVILTLNGYNPSSSSNTNGRSAQPVFPSAYTVGAPPGCVERLKVLSLSDFPTNYPRECCICMEDFDDHDDVVETACQHVFHKQCCREWLRQARTCPVCRMDIPASQNEMDVSNAEGQRSPHGSIPIGPTGRPVRGLLQILQPRERAMTSNASNSSVTASQPTGDTSEGSVQHQIPDLEDGSQR